MLQISYSVYDIDTLCAKNYEGWLAAIQFCNNKNAYFLAHLVV